MIYIYIISFTMCKKVVFSNVYDNFIVLTGNFNQVYSNRYGKFHGFLSIGS